MPGIKERNDVPGAAVLNCILHQSRKVVLSLAGPNASREALLFNSPAIKAFAAAISLGTSPADLRRRE